MSSAELMVRQIPLGSPGLRDFVRFHWQIYRGDPCWTPPLDADLLGSRWLGLKGLLTPQHPYHRHADVTHFMVWRGARPLGRISATVNRQYNDFHRTALGFFGFFEVVPEYEAARLLLDSARNWLAERGMKVMRGPGQYSNATHERQGILIDGFQYPPTVELTHNPSYYGEFLERYGLRKTKDYVAYLLHRDNWPFALLKRLLRKTSRAANIETRPLIISRLKDEVRLMVRIYNEAWQDNWGFLPISDEEGDALASSLRLIIDPQLVQFAFLNGEPAAVMGVIPDPNYALRPRWRWYGDSDIVRVLRLLCMRRRIPRLRGMFFGVRPKFRHLGIPSLMADRIADHVLRRHYRESDASLVLEDNQQIIKVIEFFGGHYYKRWRIYDLALD